MADVSPVDLDNAVRMAATEAPASDPIQQQAVVHVALNRSARSGASLSDVITSPKQFTGMGTALAQKLSANDPLYQRTLANIQPVLQGQTKDPTNGATLYLNPTLQKQNGAAIPSWADHANQTARIGGHMFYSGAFPHPEGSAPALPPSHELDAIFGLPAGSGSTPRTPAQPAQASSPGLPAQADLDKAFGVTRPPPGPPQAPASAAQAAANAAAAKAQALQPKVGPMEVLANSFQLGAEPLIAGAGAAAQTGLHNLAAQTGLIKPLPYGMGEAFTAQRDAAQQALDAFRQQHPVANVAATLGGYLGPGGLGDVAAHGATSALARLPGVAASRTLRVGSRIAGTAAAAGVAGANQAASEGEALPQIAQHAGMSAAVAAPFGVAGEAIGAASGKLLSGAPRVVRLAAPAAAGAALGGAYGASGLYGSEGGLHGAETGALAGLALGTRLDRPNEGPPTPTERASALDAVAKTVPTSPEVSAPINTAETLDQAHPLATTAEALGAKANPLLKMLPSDAAQPLHETVAERGDPTAVMGRVSSAVQEATGINPQLAQATVQDQIDAARAGPAGAAYDAALTGQPVWTPALQQLASEPEVAAAMNQARRMLGSEAMVPNPAAEQASAFPERMSSAELRARIQDGQGAAPGQEVSTNDLLQYLKSGGPTVYNVAPKTPPMVPSDRMWDQTKINLDRSVTRDAFGRAIPNNDNYLAQKWSGQVRDATNDAIPGLREARAQAGEYLSAQKAYDNGVSLTGKNAETLDSLSTKYADLSPGEQAAMQKGYTAELYKRMEKAQSFNPESIQTPFHQGVQKLFFGQQRAQQIQEALSQETSLRASGRAARGVAKGTPKEDGGHAPGIAQGALIGALEGHGVVRGALQGATGGAAIKGLSSALRSFQGKLTPGAKTALGEILAQSPQQTARELRLLRSRQRETKLSNSVLAKAGAHALRGLATYAGTEAARTLGKTR